MDIVSEVLRRHNFESLNPVQEAAAPHVLSGRNVVVSSPTASGKTLIAEMAILRAVSSGKKAVYTCPLRALASEHYKEFKSLYPEYKVALSVGDFDSADPWAKDYDVIFTTYEKLDSLVRHGAPWLSDVGVLVVDEVHEIDSSRGPTIEVLLTRFLLRKAVQVVALSATIPNASEIAEWIGAEPVLYDWRPVALREGVLYQKAILFSDGSAHEVRSDATDDLIALVEETLSMGKQILIFTMTRKNAEAIARKLRPVVRRFARSRSLLRKLSDRILHALESPTSQCRELAEDVLNGVAFHHAGLVSKQREAIEDAFRKGHILAVVATPTLAAGVNLPAFRVLLHSVKRYGGTGYEMIPVREYKQMAGRAGRPKYDDHGEAVILARDDGQVQEFLEHYILGEPENVYSRLGAETALRFHTLALIATAPSTDRDHLFHFFSNTFYALQYGEVDAVLERVEGILQWLEKNGFVRIGDRIVATDLGKRTAQLYIDPVTAKSFVDFIRKPRFGEIPFLYTVVDTSEMRPYPPVSRKEEDDLWALAEEYRDEIPVDFHSWEFDDYYFLNKWKLVLILHGWINEMHEDDILMRYDVSPGILRAYVTNAEWLAYSMGELSKLLDEKRVWRYSDLMSKRIRFGVKEELLELVQLRGIGRVRARKLYNAGIRNVHDLAKADPARVAEIIGPKVAKDVLRQIGRKLSEQEERTMKSAALRDQTTLDMFTE
ncbi:MAG: ATP-dependent helicase [Candidatus Diapherotrites archaeon]|nr:ATP-dependent helicase [Candidatus Diapherotrites archaeon]